MTSSRTKPASTTASRQLAGLDHQRLLVELALRDRLALRQRLFVALVAGLLVAAQFVVDAFQRRACRGQGLLGAHAFFERGLAFAFQRVDRGVAFRQLRSQVGEPGVELAALAAHALQRLRQGDDLRALRFDRQCQRVRGFARFARGSPGLVAGFGERAAFGIERLARAFELRHLRDRVLELRTGLARLFATGVERGHQLRHVGIDALDAVARRIQPALLALQLPGQFRHAAVGVVGSALRILALLFGGEQAVAPGGDAALEFGFTVLQVGDLAAQRLDLAFAQQGALLGRAGTQDAYPAGTEALALAGDDRFAVAQLRQHRARIGQRFGRVQFRQQATDRDRPLHFRRQRGRRECDGIVLRRNQRQATFAEFAERIDQGFRRLDQHAFDQLAERAFDRVLPARFDHQLFADARGGIESALAQPFGRRALLLPERGVLQRLQRRQPAARGLRLLADFRQLGLRGALLVLQLGDGVLARFDFGVQAFERGLLRVVLDLDAGEGFGQRGQVEARAFADELLATTIRVQRLAVEVIDAGALDVAGARGLGLGAGMRVPTLLPVGEPGLGVAQCVLLATGRRPAAAPVAARHRRSRCAARPAGLRRR